MVEKYEAEKHADKYFLRSREILEAKGMNPWVNIQVFARKTPTGGVGKVYGLNESIDLILNNSNIEKVGGRIYAKKDGDKYNSTETVMNIIAPVQEIIEHETGYLGIPSHYTTMENFGIEPDFKKIGLAMRQVVDAAGKRPVLYFGARHFHYGLDKDLARLAFENGISEVATDNGAEAYGKKGIGTIPHILENVFAYYYGVENAVVESTKALDEIIDPSIPRIALPDYNNLEIIDSLNTAKALNGRLCAVRVDTCGENLAQGGVAGIKKFWNGNGVTVMGTYALRRILDNAGFNEVGIGLTSGFSNPEKVKAFNEAEKQFGIQLYNLIGAGFSDDAITFTSDGIAVGETVEEVDFYASHVNERNIIHKVGRPPRLNRSLERIL